MQIEFSFKGLTLAAEVSHFYAATPPRFTGHPDTWCEGDPAEIVIEWLNCGEHDATFLIDSTLVDEIETAAIQAAEKHAQADYAEAIINAYC